MTYTYIHIYIYIYIYVDTHKHVWQIGYGVKYHNWEADVQNPSDEL